MLKRPKLIVLDLDKVLWDHHDVSSLKPPLKRIDKRTLEDSSGDLVTLRDDVREFLSYVKSKGIFLSTCSWNRFDRALEVLTAFELDHYFDLLVIEPHPEKQIMMERILKHFSELGVREEDTLYVDDRVYMLEKVKTKFPQIMTLRFHPAGDFFSFFRLMRILGDLDDPRL
ncbi:MAG: magnesium-dependent phosphatase-1 [Candidatus Korarchaeum sp.]|nr:magnesium-dependent phosphatase-1 [Candidatus Korarchaeum sp.]MDW8036363.1 magnesium-dependent phosphatase-1 [Candidatus Korarchaeum sp.]